MTVFVHSGFRTSSTWLWSRFRASPDTVAYSEIFNEALASLKRQQITTFHPGNWRSNHPPSAPYFLEYFPLLKDDGGIELYDKAMAFERFIPAGGPSGTVSDGEVAYVERLIGHAAGLGKTPVLTATRSLGRVAGLKAAFPGLHILLYRNLFHQWCSFSAQAFIGNTGFHDTLRFTLDGSPHDPFLRRLRESFPCNDAARDNADWFWIHAFLHLYLYAHAAGAADLILEPAALAASRDARSAMEQRIAELSGLAIDLSSVRNPIAFTLAPLGTPEALAEAIRPIADIIVNEAPTEAGRALVLKAIADILSAYRMYFEQTAALGDIVAGPQGLLAERTALRAQRDRQEEDRRRLEADLAATRDEAMRLLGCLQELRTDGEQAHKTEATLRTALEHLATEIRDLQAEQQRLTAVRDALLDSTSWRITRPLRMLRRWAP